MFNRDYKPYRLVSTLAQPFATFKTFCFVNQAEKRYSDYIFEMDMGHTKLIGDLR